MKSRFKQMVRVLVAHVSCLVLTAQAAEEGLVAHFTFDNAAQFGYDSVQKKVIGEITNSNYNNPAGAVSEPISCDAPFVRGMLFKDTSWYQSSCMTVPGSSFGSSQGIPCRGQTVTYSLWIKPAKDWQTSSTLGLGTVCFLLRHAPLGREWYKDNEHAHIYIAQGEGAFPKIVFNVGEQLAESTSASHQLPGPFDEDWHYVVATYAENVLTLYYDGDEVAKTELTAKMSVPDNSPLTVGATPTSWNTYCQRRYLGGLDDLKVYDRVLSDAEIQAAYQAGATVYDTDVLNWKGDASGGTVEECENWSTRSNRRTMEEISAAGAVFDVTTLDEAGTLTHDAVTTLNLKGVICSNGQDEVTLRMKQGRLALERPSTQRGLVAHLSFDDPVDILRDSGTAGLEATIGWWMHSSHTGEAVPNRSVEGVSGKALYFPGNDQWGYWPSPYVKTTSETTTKAHGIPKGGETVTYSLWIKPYVQGLWDNGMMGLANNGPIWIFRRGEYGNGFSTYLWLMKGDNNGRLYWSISDYIADDATCTYDPTNLFDGDWHHVVCVYDAKVLTLYYDGVKVATKEAAYALTMSDGRGISLGNSTTDGSAAQNYRRYLGGFDEFKVFNVALTDEEVAAEYAQFSKTLDAASVGTVPSPVKLQLDANTTAEVRGYGHEYGSLLGLGSLFVGPASLLKLDGTFGLSGALTGCGPITTANLVLGGDTSAYTGDFTLGENATITATALNGLTAVSTFGGKVILPAKATIDLPADVEPGKYALIKAGTLVPSPDFSQWTVTVGGKASAGRGKIVIDNNTLFCRYSSGMVIIFR